MLILAACGSVGVQAAHPGASDAPAVAQVGSEAPAPTAVAPETEAEPLPEPVSLATADPRGEPPADAVPIEAEPVEPEPVEPPWSVDDEPRILAIQPFVAAAAEEHEVDPHLVNGVIWVESKFHRKARNRSGARGLMQLMPKTAKSIGRSLKRPAKVYDAEFNVQAGTWYLGRLLSKFDGDEALALAAYVRGPAKIRAWIEQGEPFPRSVLGFVDKVQRARRAFAARGWPAAPPSEPAEPSS